MQEVAEEERELQAEQQERLERAGAQQEVRLLEIMELRTQVVVQVAVDIITPVL
jgi:hypothetical protein